MKFSPELDFFEIQALQALVPLLKLKNTLFLRNCGQIFTRPIYNFRILSESLFLLDLCCIDLEVICRTRFSKIQALQALVATFKLGTYPFFGSILGFYEKKSTRPIYIWRMSTESLFLLDLYCIDLEFIPRTRFFKIRVLQALAATFKGVLCTILVQIR